MPNENSHTILFSGQLPFCPIAEQVIYIEPNYTPEYNHYFQAHLAEIQQLFSTKAHEFCYLPTMAQNLNDAKIIQYRNPEILQYDRVLDMVNFSQSFVPYVLDKEHIRPALIRYLGHTKHGYLFAYNELELPSTTPLDQQLQAYFANIEQRAEIHFHTSESVSQNDDYADAHFCEETEQLMDEIRERVEKLRQRGIGELILKQLLQPSNKISRLHVTKDYRLFLLDYNNLEINTKSRLYFVSAPPRRHFVQTFIGVPKRIVGHLLRNYQSV